MYDNSTFYKPDSEKIFFLQCRIFSFIYLSKDAISMNRAEFGKVIVMLSTRGRSVEVIGIHWRSRIVCDMLVISWLAVVTKSIVEIRAGACWLMRMVMSLSEIVWKNIYFFEILLQIYIFFEILLEIYIYIFAILLLRKWKVS